MSAVSDARRARWGRRVGVLVLACVAGHFAWAGIAPHLVDRARFVQPASSLTITDGHGVPLRLTRSDGEDRRWVRLGDVSPHLIDAFIAVEDARFAEHDGVDLLASGRALLSVFVPGMRLSGGSTLTQQTVKLTYGRPHGLWSKPLETFRALALEEVMSKDEILEQYLNRVPFGDRIVGVGRASEAYFGKPPSRLSVAEAALLAGIPQAPSATEPRRHLPRALRRRNLVLARMLETGRIDAATHEDALASEPRVLARPTRPWKAPRFVDAVLRAHRRGDVAADNGVLSTTLDVELQRAAEELTRATVERLTPRGVRNAAALIVDNRDGSIRAYVGAADPDGPGGAIDLLRARRQPGSTLKPFVYQLLFERGGTAATVLDDIARPMTGAGGVIFEAEDYDGAERGPVRARHALAASLNLAALDAATRVGPERVVERLRALGLRLGDADQYGAAIALGGPDVAPLELAHAYVVLARRGRDVSLHHFPSDDSPTGSTMSEGAAAITRDILFDGVARRDAFGDDLEILAGGPFALKTGTSSGWRDAWAIVFDDAHTVLVWLGDPGGGALASVSGFEGAAPTAARILGAARAMSEPPVVEVDAPVLVASHVCALSGARPGPGCAAVVRERFVPGTLPREVCPFHDHTSASGATTLPARYARWLSATRRADTRAEVAPSTGELRLTSPRDGARLMVDARRGTTITLRATRGGQPVIASFRVDGEDVGERWHPTPGDHEIEARAGNDITRAHIQVAGI